jgi:hypothetical protein
MWNYVKTSMSNYATKDILLNNYVVTLNSKKGTPQYKAQKKALQLLLQGFFLGKVVVTTPKQ